MVKLDTDAHLDELGFFQDDFNILDIGCGVGYIPSYLRRSRKRVKYLGLDVRLDRIKLCRRLFRDMDYKFTHLNLRSSSYNPIAAQGAENLVIPLDDCTVDSIICHSLFTHLDTEEVASRYIDEIKRVLKPNGFLWTTWFSSPPNTTSDGTKRTVYDLAFIHDRLAQFEFIYLGGGETSAYHDQLEIACVKC